MERLIKRTGQDIISELASYVVPKQIITLEQLLWEIFSAIISLFNGDLRRQKQKVSTMGPADLVISKPRNNSSSNLSELGLLDF